MKHAYLIIAHSNWEQLKLLLRSLDSDNTDIYVHIDKKSKNVPFGELQEDTSKSKINIYSEYKVYWGSYSMVQVELFLFEKAHEKGYDYYHLLSGVDLPIKSKEEIDAFFEKNNGNEYVHFDTEERMKNDKEIGRRARLYHFLQDYRRRYKVSLFNKIFTFIERALLLMQMIFGVNRLKKYPQFCIKYGSQWVSITDKLVAHILDNKALISSMFRYTSCADELFIQSLVYNSGFVQKLYDNKFDDSPTANMRLIDIKKRGKNGNPYTWKLSDWNELEQSECLFARKFNIEEDRAIVDKIIDKCEIGKIVC